MKRGTIILIVVVVLIVVLIAITWFLKPKALKPSAAKAAVAGNKIPAAGNGSGGVSIAANSPAPYVGKTGITGPGLNQDLVLQYGSTGPEVTELQTLMLKVDPEAVMNVDGVFGPETEFELNSLSGLTSITLKDAWAYWTDNGNWMSTFLPFINN